MPNLARELAEARSCVWLAREYLRVRPSDAAEQRLARALESLEKAEAAVIDAQGLADAEARHPLRRVPPDRARHHVQGDRLTSATESGGQVRNTQPPRVTRADSTYIRRSDPEMSDEHSGSLSGIPLLDPGGMFLNGNELGNIRHVHTHSPRATEIDIDVAITTTGRTLTVKIGRAALPGESDDAAAEKALLLSLLLVGQATDAFAARGMVFGKLEVGAK